MNTLLSEEEIFYKDYQWCLDPMPKWGDMRAHFLGELERWSSVSMGWQERERALNGWLMGSALWQGVSDYVVRGYTDLERWKDLAGPLEHVLSPLRACNEAAIRLRNRTLDRSLLKQDGSWRTLLRELAGRLLDDRPASAGEKERLRRLAGELLTREFPAGLTGSRIRIPSLFRSEDITHHDIATLLAQYVAGSGDRERPLLVVGLRTAGAYLAPFAHAYLERRGYTVVDSITLRPGGCLSAVEKEILERSAGRNAGCVLISEPPRTGKAIGDALRCLGGAGIAPARISVLFPSYPANEQWKQQAWARQSRGVTVCALPWNRWYLSEYLKGPGIRRVLDDYFAGQDAQLIGIEETCRSKCIDNRFGKHERIGWRLKRTYKVTLWDREGRQSCRQIMGKSVGWGWLGYHAFIQADRLKGFVPPVLGLRSGLLFMDWIEGRSCKSPDLDVRKIIPRVLAYIFARMDRLSLPEDMTFREDSRKYYGGQFLVAVLSRAYGKRLGAFVQPLLRRILRKYGTRHPAAIDGRIAPEECILDGDKLWKIDFEHHGFGATELNIADPVFDLASFIFEFRLNAEQREQALAAYIERTGDARARDKVILYLWLIAHYNLGNEKAFLSDAIPFRRSIEENRKYASDRAYGNLLSLEHFARFVIGRRPGRKNRNCFIMNIDGVLDREIWDFPTTTISGIRAISLLHRHGFPIYINTARIMPDVQAYCEYFGLEGGIAEYGSALWDRRTKRLTVLVDPETREELREMRRHILELPGVFINPQSQYCINAFRHGGGITLPLEPEKVLKIMALRGFTRLKAFVSDNVTVIMAKALDKGIGMDRLLAGIRNGPERVISVGYADSDIPMLERSNIAFAPQELIARMPGGNIRIAVPKYQAGLFDAARISVRRCCGSRDLRTSERAGEKGDLMVELIRVADQRRLGKLFSLVALPLG